MEVNKCTYYAPGSVLNALTYVISVNCYNILIKQAFLLLPFTGEETKTQEC